MYNRYIPQSDGSYQKNWIPDPPAPSPRRKPQPPPDPPKASCPPPSAPHNIVPPCRQEHNALDFLKNLLPKDLDTGDLLIVLLLLLMSGDCAEEKNTALLTLALYLFM